MTSDRTELTPKGIRQFKCIYDQLAKEGLEDEFGSSTATIYQSLGFTEAVLKGMLLYLKEYEPFNSDIIRAFKLVLTHLDAVEI